MIDYKEEIKKNQIIVFIIPNKLYQDRLLKIIKDLAAEYNRICYISLNKPAKTLMRLFDNNKIDKKKFLFIDAITQTVKTPEPADTVLFISSPRAITELNITINKALEVGKIQCIVFDSLSTMLIYEKPMTVIKFVHSIMAKLRTINCAGVFTCLSEDVSPDLIKDLNMFVDRLIDLKDEEKE